jgi:O-antigen/teichoic acid export membrane protein
MDNAVSRTLFMRAWSLVSGLAMVVLVPIFLNSYEQGFYFTFSSILGIQIFFELGLSQVLVYKFAGLNSQVNAENVAHINKHQKLLFAARVLYRFLSICFFVVTVISGYIFLSRQPDNQVSWHFQWLTLVLLTSINLAQSVKLTYIESVGEMASVSIARLRANFIGTILFIISFLCGGKLWSACAVPLSNVAVLTTWIYTHSRSSVYRYQRTMGSSPIAEISSLWSNEIFPMQWKVSLSWISGYFIFQLYTPIVMARFGSVEAGKLGFIISIISSLSFVGSTFTSALAPKLASLYSAGRIKDFNKIFDQSLLLSIFSLAVLLFSVPIGVLICSIYFHFISDRLPSPLHTLIYSFSAFCSGVVYLFSIYLRSQQKEPLLILSIVFASVMVPTLLVGSIFSLSLMLTLALFANIAALLWCLVIFKANRRLLLEGQFL